jgi:SAM-dependent methyltransferase
MVAKWNERYRRGGYRASEAPDPLVVTAAELLAPGRAIDLACGAGRHALWLAARGWRVTAIDGAEAALALFDAPGITKLCVDLATEPVSLDADLAVDTMYLDRRLFPVMRREARAVVIVLPMPDDDPQVAPMNPAYLVEAGELERAFEGWRVLRSGIRKEAGWRRRMEYLAVRPD